MAKIKENREVVEVGKEKNFKGFPIWDINNVIGKFPVDFLRKSH